MMVRFVQLQFTVRVLGSDVRLVDACRMTESTVMAGSDVVQTGRPIFDDFLQHLWPYIGNNTANAVF
ncbi:hypothetical protein TNCV_4673411 [Trichonephila clavipes]|nr:hypothetical protein TNCV_4673411 [Trichonephila clavipes]